jgi:hypothetical protein
MSDTPSTSVHELAERVIKLLGDDRDRRLFAAPKRQQEHE